MKIKRIVLDNIRSYEHEEVEFPEGSILLSGDIGSGKSSILLAIEFALFGLQPGKKGTSLLRNGKDEGSVSLWFEVDGSEIEIERTLKKNSKTVSQDKCFISIDGQQEETSVTELKDKVLELLNYPKEFAKKQNLLYKFTVYTPQEEMKQIMLQDPETRVNTIRHVFGIDKYKRILENSSFLSSKIREEKRQKEGATQNLEEDKKILEERQEELKKTRESLKKAEKEVEEKKSSRENIEKERDEIYKKIEEKNKYQQEIEKSKIMVSNKKETVNNNNNNIEKLKQQINEIESLNFNPEDIKKQESSLEELKKRREEINEKNINLTSQINSLQSKNEENEKTKQKISRIEVCPTCLQDVDSVYKSNIENQMDSKTAENNKKIKELQEEKTKNQGKLKEIDEELSSVQKKIQDLNVLKVKVEGLEEKKEQLQKLQDQNNSLEKDIEILNQQINSLKNSIVEYSKYDNQYEEKSKQLEEASKEEKKSEIQKAELKKEIDLYEKQIQDLKTRIEKTEKQKKQLEYLAELENWLSSKFTPVVSNIERNVMIKLKAEFSRLFSEWFDMLVSDSFHVSLDDNFTPIIQQKDYEIDYEYLSGGERTAVALAYRLSLNQVINSFLSKIKTRDLVILDEPTDGFSEQQLDKMREVLHELNVSQLIIVSHEQKIENFVEQAIRFKKENETSKIERGMESVVG